MVLSILLGVLVVALLVKIVMGPARWHRTVTQHTSPGSVGPSHWGEVLVAARDFAVLAVLGVLLGVVLVDWVGEWRTDERLYDATYAAVQILPNENLQTTQVETLVEQLTGEEVLLVDASEEDGEVSLDEVYWAPDDLSVPEGERDLPAPAACLSVARDSMGGLVDVQVTEGSCADRPE